MNLEYDSNGNILLIPNEDLLLENIPGDDCSFAEYFKFAHTFDGYEVFGDDAFTVCNRCDVEGNDLSSLRNFLFIKARGWRHSGGPEPNNDEWNAERCAIRSIRRIVSERNLMSTVQDDIPLDDGFRLTLQSLLEQSGVDLSDALIMRHTPPGALGIAYPSLAATNHEVFHAYQSIQGPAYEKRLKQKGWLISFVVDAAGQTVLAGVFRKENEILDSSKIEAANRVLSRFAFQSTAAETPIWFELSLSGHLSKFRGRLVVEWHNHISWCRDADSPKSVFEVTSISPESLLVPPKLPHWRSIIWKWDDLKTLPQSWRIAISQWRAIYLIHDSSTNKNYVGSAYGSDNLLARWEGYAKSGNNDNKHLKPLDPSGFSFSILEVLSHTATESEVTTRESTWKKRLHTLYPNGLNGNA
ncbi:GIY-YIG nuclease family protein [Novipirellula rosea]|uniref:GIY-YIG domain-containing protein n=1 Tax=Novipirellula rosea TaxID=1031540 RepID=A0ABP8NXE8_9BACT